MCKKDLTDIPIEQGYIKPFDSPYVLDGDSSSFQYILDGESPQKEEKRPGMIPGLFCYVAITSHVRATQPL